MVVGLFLKAFLKRGCVYQIEHPITDSVASLQLWWIRKDTENVNMLVPQFGYRQACSYIFVCPPHPKSVTFSIWTNSAEGTASLVSLTSSAFLQSNAPRFQFRKICPVVLRMPGFHGFGIFNFKDCAWIKKGHPEAGENKSDQFNILSSCYMYI